MVISRVLQGPLFGRIIYRYHLAQKNNKYINQFETSGLNLTPYVNFKGINLTKYSKNII